MKSSLPACLRIALLAIPLGLRGAMPVLPAPGAVGEGALAPMAKYLNAGGSLYLRLDSRAWARRLDEKVAWLGALVQELAEETDRKEAAQAFALVRAFVRDSGLRELAGVGFSSVETAGGLFHNRVFLQHSVDAPEGLFWRLLAARNESLDLLRRLPENTAAACWLALRPAAAGEWLRGAVREVGLEELAPLLDGDGMRRLADGLAGGAGYVLALDPGRQAELDLGRGLVTTLPAFEAAAVFAVKDDTILDALADRLADQRVEKRDDGNGTRAWVWPGRELPHLADVVVEPTLARFGDYLVLATSPRLVECLAARREGLLAAPRFQRYRQNMPTAGVAFSFLDPVAGQSLCDALRPLFVPGAESPAEAALGSVRNLGSFAVSVRTPDGVAVVANESTGVLRMLSAKYVAWPSFLAAGKLFLEVRPLLGLLCFVFGDSAEPTDGSNLETIRRALAIHAARHGDRYPGELGGLLDEELLEGEHLVSPGSDTVAPSNAADVRAGRCDYLCLTRGRRRLENDDDDRLPLACLKPGVHEDKPIEFVYANGEVGYFGDEIPEDFARLIEVALGEAE